MIKTGFVQFSPVFGDVTGNVKKALGMAAASGAGIVVLPELFSTGYLFESREELQGLAEPPDGPTVSAACRLAAARKMWICGGFAEKGASGCYNAAFLAGPAGLAGVYRKSHLFAGEKDLFLPGDTGFNVIDTGLAKVGMMICFDWIFPELARSLAIQGADILCHPANLVLPYCQDAMITRCIENRVFAATANRTGVEERAGQRLAFTGMSQIVAQNGRVLARAGGDRDDVLLAEIAPWDAREKWVTPANHVLADRRPLLYTLGAVESRGR